METNENNTAPNQVELILPGIDKVWVRSPKGQWVDKESLKQVEQPPTINQEVEVVSLEKKPWWKFWAKFK